MSVKLKFNVEYITPIALIPKKGNVLSKIVVPRLNVTCLYITSELEEKEREETFRLKRVKQKKDGAKSIEIPPVVWTDTDEIFEKQKQPKLETVSAKPVNIKADNDEDGTNMKAENTRIEETSSSLSLNKAIEDLDILLDPKLSFSEDETFNDLSIHEIVNLLAQANLTRLFDESNKLDVGKNSDGMPFRNIINDFKNNLAKDNDTNEVIVIGKPKLIKEELCLNSIENNESDIKNHLAGNSKSTTNGILDPINQLNSNTCLEKILEDSSMETVITQSNSKLYDLASISPVKISATCSEFKETKCIDPTSTLQLLQLSSFIDDFSSSIFVDKCLHNMSICAVKNENKIPMQVPKTNKVMNKIIDVAQKDLKTKYFATGEINNNSEYFERYQIDRKNAMKLKRFPKSSQESVKSDNMSDNDSLCNFSWDFSDDDKRADASMTNRSSPLALLSTVKVCMKSKTALELNNPLKTMPFANNSDQKENIAILTTSLSEATVENNNETLNESQLTFSVLPFGSQDTDAEENTIKVIDDESFEIETSETFFNYDSRRSGTIFTVNSKCSYDEEGSSCSKENGNSSRLFNSKKFTLFNDDISSDTKDRKQIQEEINVKHSEDSIKILSTIIRHNPLICTLTPNFQNPYNGKKPFFFQGFSVQKLTELCADVLRKQNQNILKYLVVSLPHSITELHIFSSENITECSENEISAAALNFDGRRDSSDHSTDSEDVAIEMNDRPMTSSEILMGIEFTPTIRELKNLDLDKKNTGNKNFRINMLMDVQTMCNSNIHHVPLLEINDSFLKFHLYDNKIEDEFYREYTIIERLDTFINVLKRKSEKSKLCYDKIKPMLNDNSIIIRTSTNSIDFDTKKTCAIKEFASNISVTENLNHITHTLANIIQPIFYSTNIAQTSESDVGIVDSIFRVQSEINLMVYDENSPDLTFVDLDTDFVPETRLKKDMGWTLSPFLIKSKPTRETDTKADENASSVEPFLEPVNNLKAKRVKYIEDVLSSQSVTNKSIKTDSEHSFDNENEMSSASSRGESKSDVESKHNDEKRAESKNKTKQLVKIKLNKTYVLRQRSRQFKKEE